MACMNTLINWIQSKRARYGRHLAADWFID
jgi:hypothetical protein